MRLIDMSLLEQMRITDNDIQHRKELLNLTAADSRALQEFRPCIELSLDAVIEEFYAIQTSFGEVALLIGDADTFAKLKAEQRKYILSLFDGVIDIEYIKHRLRIGMVHKRIGVEPKYFLAAIHHLRTILARLLEENIADKTLCLDTLAALNKMVYFDSTLIIDTYIHSLMSEIHLSRDKLESYATELEHKVLDRTRQLEDLATRDGLTGLFNQRAFIDIFARELIRARRNRAPLTLAYLDIDSFKQINDSHGHLRGDEVLKGLGDIMKDISRESDFPARYGGDEFCMLMPDTGVGQGSVLCERLKEKFTAAFHDITLSIGLAQTGPEEFVTRKELIQKADVKMYESKAKAGFQIAW
jgi:diguanylate cyclase (GGDEF)-like protein